MNPDSNPPSRSISVRRGQPIAVRQSNSLVARGLQDIAQLGRPCAEEFVARGNTFFRQGDYDAAIADYTEAIRLDPRHAKAYYNRGYAYEKKGELDKAIADYTERIRLDPNANSYIYRGLACLDRIDLLKGDRDAERYTEAIADLIEGIRRIPDDTTNAAKRANVIDIIVNDYKFWGHTYLDKGETNKGIENLTEGIRWRPDDAKGYRERGEAYAEIGEYDKAIIDFTEAIRLAPKFAQTYFDRGHAYHKKGDHGKAKLDFEQAERLGFTPQ